MVDHDGQLAAWTAMNLRFLHRGSLQRQTSSKRMLGRHPGILLTLKWPARTSRVMAFLGTDRSSAAKQNLIVALSCTREQLQRRRPRLVLIVKVSQGSWRFLLKQRKTKIACFSNEST